jgi:hypothetical protein
MRDMVLEREEYRISTDETNCANRAGANTGNCAFGPYLWSLMASQ